MYLHVARSMPTLSARDYTYTVDVATKSLHTYTMKENRLLEVPSAISDNRRTLLTAYWRSETCTA